MLNERIAEHHRGGLLTQGSILSLTSDGTRHRPVHRGVRLLESIIGKPAPPPPANVPALTTPAPNTKKSTVREKLEQHRCRSQTRSQRCAARWPQVRRRREKD
jgi:hypothetical protein